ncbi:hypothetical protein [Catellatospora methionotrophica]|uniref:DUF5983 family protein n=1 Tax=Catellatospora methionotrophica TaxID=121620 RepID=UPI0033D0C2A2
MTAVHTMLELSTHHLPEHVRDNLAAYTGMQTFDLPRGWLTWVPIDPDHPTAVGELPTPPQLLAIHHYARKLGANFVLFNAEADLNDHLPTWD